jgi:uncharacterized protein
MLFEKFDKANLLNKLVHLDRKKRIAFAAACCERLVPNYMLFKNETNWGNEIPLKDGLDYIWNYLSGFELSKEKVEGLIRECENIAPESEDFDSLYTSLAQDAAFAICSALDYFIVEDIGRIVQAATYAYDTVDLYVQEIEMMDPVDPDLENKILNHRLIQGELKNQHDDLVILENESKMTPMFVAIFRMRWHDKSNIKE